MAGIQVDVPHPSLSRRLPRWLEFWIALSAAVALASTGAVIFYALGKLASEVNNTDLGLTRQSARAAISAFETRLRDNLQDYANWDDAALKLYNTPDEEFVSDIFQDVTNTALVFDTAFLVDEMGKDLAGYKNGRKISVTSQSFFGHSLKALIGMFDASGLTYQSAGGLVRTPDGVAAVAIGLVVPYSKDLKLPKGQRRLLLIAKHLTPANIERLRN